MREASAIPADPDSLEFSFRVGASVLTDVAVTQNFQTVDRFLQSPGSVSYCATKAWMNSFTNGYSARARRNSA